MHIKKILVVPVDTLVEEVKRSALTSFFRKASAYGRILLGQSGFSYDGELQFYGDLPLVLGRENTFVFGTYHPHLHIKRVPNNSPYPSCHGTPDATYIAKEELESTIRAVDAVFISTRAGARRDLSIKLARSFGKPLALFDFEDHHTNYGAADIRKDLCRGFAAGKDYDIYFKKDLPLGYGTDAILPIAPIAVRPESYSFPDLAKDTDIFYSGRIRPGCQADREESIALVKNNFSRTRIFEHQTQGSFMTLSEYFANLSRSKLALSPSGKVWDSFRHCEVGLAPETLIIAPKPYVEVVGPAFEDGVNGIFYDTIFRDGKYHVAKQDELIEKIRYYIDHDAERITLARKFSEDVRMGHTILARSRDIIRSMERAL